MTIKVAVIGAGIMGAAAAYSLSRRGAEVTIFEQFAARHDRGSSHGVTRLFRTAYFEHPDYVPLLKRAAASWRALENVSGETLLEMCGVFMAGMPENPLISGTMSAAEKHGLGLEQLTRRDASARFPWFSLGRAMETLIEPEAGFIYADKAHAAFLAGAAAHGAILCQNHAIEGWEGSGANVDIVFDGQRRGFDKIILTPGAYAGHLKTVGGALVKPMRKRLFWTTPNERRFTLSNGFLPFGIEDPDGRFVYGFPAIDSDGVKVGEHTGGAMVESPDRDDANYSNEARRDMAAFLRRRTPGLASMTTKEQSCLYAMSPDGHFIIDLHPDDERVILAMGFSGHGFKFAPVIGEALADLARTGETVKEFDFLKLKRFSQA